MEKTKILFLIHDLGQGGAEKVLVNLVNHLDRSRFDVSVKALFGGGVHERDLREDVHFSTVYPRSVPLNSHWMKLFSPKRLHRLYIKERYDIEVSYLEGPCARIISGCTDEHTRLISWIHTRYTRKRDVAASFRSEKEARACYGRFDHTVCVSEDVKAAFCRFVNLPNPCGVLYNTLESETIRRLAAEDTAVDLPPDAFKLVAVGTLKAVKRYDRLLNIAKRLKEESYNVHTYLLGAGPLKEELAGFVKAHDLDDCVTLLGYDANPYKTVAKCDLFVCCSQTEGFSTAAAEALIVGTPVCTVDVSGMREMLGENNEYGVITENSEEALYEGIKRLLDDPALQAHYKEKARERGQRFCTEQTVQAAEALFLS